MHTREPYIYPESTTRRKVRTMTDEGFSVREIAQALGITTQAVYAHRRKIRKADAEEKAS